MAIRPDEITSVLKQQLEQYRATLNVSNVGSVLQVGDGIARVYGMEKAMAGELVEFDDKDKTYGMVLNLEEDNVGVVILGEGRELREGMAVRTTGRIASTPVGEAMLGPHRKPNRSTSRWKRTDRCYRILADRSQSSRYRSP